jgi:hypothetical protein
MILNGDVLQTHSGVGGRLVRIFEFRWVTTKAKSLSQKTFLYLLRSRTQLFQ